MNKRNLASRILAALTSAPAVFLGGARHTGKTALVKSLKAAGQRTYISLESATTLAGALADPIGFLRALPKPVTIDEVQRAPALLLAIKEDIDQDRQPGRYLLTGSANILTSSGVADSLAGSMEILTLYPFSQGETAGIKDDFIARIFAADFQSKATESWPWPRGRLLQAMILGGYPEVRARPRAERRAAWFESYLTTLIERDVRDIANLQDRGGLIRLLRLMAAHSGTLINASELGRASGLANSTLNRYLAVLEALFLVWFLPAWPTNLGKRLVKSPKLQLIDSGFAAYLCGAYEERLAVDSSLAERFLESFVVSEIRRQTTWSEHPVELYHYSSYSGEKVDLVLEDRSGRVAAVEVRFSETLNPHEAKGLIHLRDALGEKFVRGVIFYLGAEILPLTDKILALPVSYLFSPYFSTHALIGLLPAEADLNQSRAERLSQK
jgi:predicted AAA+ superfamily ATPase